MHWNNDRKAAESVSIISTTVGVSDAVLLHTMCTVQFTTISTFPTNYSGCSIFCEVCDHYYRPFCDVLRYFATYSIIFDMLRCFQCYFHFHFFIFFLSYSYIFNHTASFHTKLFNQNAPHYSAHKCTYKTTKNIYKKTHYSNHSMKWIETMFKNKPINENHK